jgi:DNA-binding NarL/FixJ family response regulator
MADRIAVYVYANDPVSEAGMTQLVRARPDMRVVDDSQIDQAAVAVIVVDEIDDDAVRVVRGIARDGCPRVLVVATHLEDASVVRAAEAGTAGLMRRREASSDRLADAVTRVARGEGTLPPDLLGSLMQQLSSVQRGVDGSYVLRSPDLTDREAEVLRMVAEGCDTAEIARQLCYSERTVKGVIQTITTRLHLRNRSHAVAFAVRNGLI